MVKAKSDKQSMWAIYLRLLDAKKHHAKTPEIIKAIPKRYGQLNELADSYAMTDRVSDDLKAARYLQGNPYQLLK